MVCVCPTIAFFFVASSVTAKNDLFYNIETGFVIANASSKV